MKIVLSILTALLLCGCASKSELQKSPCACEPDQYYDRQSNERVNERV
jgi:uncharacterized protein YceK